MITIEQVKENLKELIGQPSLSAKELTDEIIIAFSDHEIEGETEVMVTYSKYTGFWLAYINHKISEVMTIETKEAWNSFARCHRYKVVAVY